MGVEACIGLSQAETTGRAGRRLRRSWGLGSCLLGSRQQPRQKPLGAIPADCPRLWHAGHPTHHRAHAVWAATGWWSGLRRRALPLVPISVFECGLWSVELCWFNAEWSAAMCTAHHPQACCMPMRCCCVACAKAARCLPGAGVTAQLNGRFAWDENQVCMGADNQRSPVPWAACTGEHISSACGDPSLPAHPPTHSNLQAHNPTAFGWDVQSVLHGKSAAAHAGFTARQWQGMACGVRGRCCFAAFGARCLLGSDPSPCGRRSSCPAMHHSSPNPLLTARAALLQSWDTTSTARTHR